MKKLFLLVSLMFAAVSSRAEVVIYTQTYSETVTGDGYTSTTNFTGYFVFDDSPDGAIASLDARTLKVGRTSYKLMTSYNTFDYSWAYLQSALVQKTLVIASSPQSDAVGSALLKGKSYSLDVGTGITFLAPKTMTLSGSALKDSLLHEYKGTMTFNSTATKAANVAGRDIDAAISFLTVQLAAKGYTLTD